MKFKFCFKNGRLQYQKRAFLRRFYFIKSSGKGSNKERIKTKSLQSKVKQVSTQEQYNFL
jgi:hypothetical protein